MRPRQAAHARAAMLPLTHTGLRARPHRRATYTTGMARKKHVLQLRPRPLVRSAFCPNKIDLTSGLTLHPGYNSV